MNKKCLYISDNKAIVRNKDLICIADITKDDTYKNLYVESCYKEDYGEVYIDLGIICMYAYRGIFSYEDTKDIESKLSAWKEITLETYKNYIVKCLNNNQFINVAEIKLMELAGEPKKYIQQLVEHRQKVIDIREQESREREEKRERENQEYVEQKNKEVTDKISKAEEAILNKGKIKNEDIEIYKSRYDYNITSIILHMMKLYDIKVPLKTQGWINQALHSIWYNNSGEYWTYEYYTSSKNSTVFEEYLNQLVGKIEEKYGDKDEITEAEADENIKHLFGLI